LQQDHGRNRQYQTHIPSQNISFQKQFT
jgi:hypothetical protein